MTGAATRAVPTKVPWRDRTPLALLIGALSLRMLALGSKSLWSDEAFSWWHALLGPAEIWARNGDPHHPPLYYIVLSWVVPISDSEFALRFPSALASALTVLFVYLLARRLTDSFGGALLAGVLVALSPLDVWYAQEARQAAMGTFLMVAASYGLIRRDGIGRLIGVVSLTGAFFSYYVTLAVWAALLGVGTYIFWKERKPFLREWVIVSAPSVAVFAVLQGEHFVSGFASLLSLADRPFVNALMSVGAGPASVLVVGAIGRAGVPSIMTLHNYRLTCIAATLSRDGRPCDLCVHGSGWNGVRHRCYRDDLASSAIALAGTNSTRATALRHVSTFAVLTEFAREVYVEAGFDPERLIVLPNFTEDPGPRNLPAEKSETVLFIGRLSPEKGIDRFLDAWEKGGTGLRLLVIGEGPLGAVLRRRHPDISFTGHLQPDEVRQLLLEARCLALPSTWYEGQSLVLLEAMAAGVPIMASDWPPIAETLSSSAAMLIDAHDVDAWVSAIRRVAADDGLISSASRASRDRWAGRHSPRAGLERLRDAYKSIVERAHG